MVRPIPEVGIYPDELRRGASELGISAEVAAQRAAIQLQTFLQFNIDPKFRESLVGSAVADLRRRFPQVPECAALRGKRAGWKFW